MNDDLIYAGMLELVVSLREFQRMWELEMVSGRILVKGDWATFCWSGDLLTLEMAEGDALVLDGSLADHVLEMLGK